MKEEAGVGFGWEGDVREEGVGLAGLSDSSLRIAV